jgi:hypothetical protein
MSDSKDIA